jgi:hypothetical protein
MSMSVPILVYHLKRPRQMRGFAAYKTTRATYCAQSTWLGHIGCASLTLDEPRDAAAQPIARDAEYRSACSVGIGPSAPDHDPPALHRVHVSGHGKLPEFMRKLDTDQSIDNVRRQEIRVLRRAQSAGQ